MPMDEAITMTPQGGLQRSPRSWLLEAIMPKSPARESQKSCVCVCVCVVCTQSCPTLCDPMDYSPPGSSVHGNFQARILEWAAILYSRGSSRPRHQIHISCVSCRNADSLPLVPLGKRHFKEFSRAQILVCRSCLFLRSATGMVCDDFTLPEGELGQEEK